MCYPYAPFVRHNEVEKSARLFICRREMRGEAEKKAEQKVYSRFGRRNVCNETMRSEQEQQFIKCFILNYSFMCHVLFGPGRELSPGCRINLK